MTDQPQGGGQGAGERDVPPTSPLGSDSAGWHGDDRATGASEAGPEPHTEGQALEGELLNGDQPGSTSADALLAEVFDAAELEAELSAVESQTESVSDEIVALTSDLQRLHAEYSNYKKRVDRDRDLVRERAVEAALSALLPVLDDLDLAGQHGELVGGFKSVADKLVSTLATLGMTSFGAVGEPFDPARHEALMRESVPEVTEPTVVRVLQVGYQMNGRILRAARVSVAGTD